MTETEFDWHSWSPYPIPPANWPGLYDRSKDGFDVERAELRSVAGYITRVTTYVAEVGIENPLPEWGLTVTWSKAREVYDTIRFMHGSIRRLRGDIAHELIAAALLVYRVGDNYDLAEDPNLLHAPGEIRDLANDYWEPMSISWGYPKSEDEMLSSLGDSLDLMSIEDIREELSAFSGGGVRALGTTLKSAADEFAEAFGALARQAYKIYDAPWRGAAACGAQEKLAQIAGNMTALAKLSGLAGQVAEDFDRVMTERNKSFESAVDKDRGWWHETFDLGGGPTSRARDHLRDAYPELDKILDKLPPSIREDLPGLIQEAARRGPRFAPSPQSLRVAKKTIEELQDKIDAATSLKASEARNAQMWEESGTMSKNNEEYLEGLREQLKKAKEEYAEAQK